jgi:hypothetical protein
MQRVPDPDDGEMPELIGSSDDDNEEEGVDPHTQARWKPPPRSSRHDELSELADDNRQWWATQVECKLTQPNLGKWIKGPATDSTEEGATTVRTIQYIDDHVTITTSPWDPS